mmetsp:Transcript_15127/g.19297  ORF Transcript_15127/g.19297 Transcript_15127/m.19297 type:complete len:191 (+) Transcript_15127:80-652(+)
MMCQFPFFPLIRTLLALACIGQKTNAFQMMNLRRSSTVARTIHQQPIDSYLSAESNTGGSFFQDDDCEDLCDAFGEQTLMASLANRIQETVPPQGKSVPPMRRIKRSLWSDPKPTKCEACSGVGSTYCRFCGGVSFLSGIGGETDALFIDGIGKSCPVCDDGNEACRECSGTGYIFSWKKPIDDADSMHP